VVGAGISNDTSMPRPAAAELQRLDLPVDGGYVRDRSARTTTGLGTTDSNPGCGSFEPPALSDDRTTAGWDAVEVVAMDPHAGYRAAVAEALPNARVVVDHFHLVRLANLMVTDVRQRVAREQL
jgi:hypothetical protein